MTNENAGDVRESDAVLKYDLEERTAVFAERVIDFALDVERNAVTMPLITQLVRAGTSIGANYCEADDAESKRDFRHKIGLCRKEARETKYWFRMIARAAPLSKPPARPLWQEAKELHLIFSKIRRSCDRNTSHDNSE
ncbi:MAG: four helix bundle protein [Planctomycetes bacterium]|nr:four helix bundle protein [Planctomycetota bacterium]